MASFSDAFQLIFVDALFLCIAGGIGWWFRAWLREEKEALDQRLAALESAQNRMEQAARRLQEAVRCLERRLEEDAAPFSGKGDGSRRFSPFAGKEADYEQAWRLLSRGCAPVEVARRLGLGIAEVELLARMRRRKTER